MTTVVGATFSSRGTILREVIRHRGTFISKPLINGPTYKGDAVARSNRGIDPHDTPSPGKNGYAILTEGTGREEPASVPDLVTEIDDLILKEHGTKACKPSPEIPKEPQNN